MKNISIGFDPGTCFGIAGGVAEIVTAIAYIAYGASNPLVLAALLAGIALEGASLVKDWDIFTILSPVCCMAALCFFVMDSVYIFVAYFFNLAMFGDITKIGPVSRISVLAGIAVILLLIASFTKKDRRK